MEPNDEEFNVKLYEGQVLRLYHHLGFPCRDNLGCTIFLQNKCGYGFGIAEFILPSLVVPLTTNIDDPVVIDIISK